MCWENKILYPDFIFSFTKKKFFEKNKNFELFSNVFTNNIYLVLKLPGGGYYGTHWRAGNRPPFLLAPGLLPEEHLFVCLFVVCQEGGVTRITWQKFFL